MKNKSIQALLILIIIIGLFALYKTIDERAHCKELVVSTDHISSSTLQLLSEMRNSDVQWDGNYIGYFPMPGGATLTLVVTEEDIDKLLINAILDREKFFIAHVLLSLRESPPINPPVISGPVDDLWNGVKIQFGENGVTYQWNDLCKLQRFWLEKLQPQSGDGTIEATSAGAWSLNAGLQNFLPIDNLPTFKPSLPGWAIITSNHANQRIWLPQRNPYPSSPKCDRDS